MEKAVKRNELETWYIYDVLIIVFDSAFAFNSNINFFNEIFLTFKYVAF